MTSALVILIGLLLITGIVLIRILDDQRSMIDELEERVDNFGGALFELLQETRKHEKHINRIDRFVN